MWGSERQRQSRDFYGLSRYRHVTVSFLFTLMSMDNSVEDNIAIPPFSVHKETRYIFNED